MIAEYRADTGYSQEGIGEQVGLSRAMIHAIETRKALPSLRSFRDLCVFMQLPPIVVGELVLAQQNIDVTPAENKGTIWDDRRPIKPTGKRKARSNV